MNRPAFLHCDRSLAIECRLAQCCDSLWSSIVTISTGAVAALAATSEGAQLALQFDRTAIGEGQVWRIVTGHLVHWSTNHFLWDAVMFGVLGAVCERADRRRYVACLLGSAVVISAAIAGLLPDTILYRGLSGVDSALFILASVVWLRGAWRDRNLAFATVVVIALAGFIGKLVYEVTTGATLFVDSAGAGFVPLPLAHAVGAAVGAAVAFAPGSIDQDVPDNDDL